MITKWNTIHPREDIARGISFTYLKKGFKISKIFDKNNKFVFWYCDIIEVIIDDENNIITVIDLLVDVKIMPDGKVLILDVEEVALAIDNSLITQKQASNALKKLNKLLDIIYYGNFPPKECEKWLNY